MARTRLEFENMETTQLQLDVFSDAKRKGKKVWALYGVTIPADTVDLFVADYINDVQQEIQEICSENYDSQYIYGSFNCEMLDENSAYYNPHGFWSRIKDWMVEVDLNNMQPRKLEDFSTLLWQRYDLNKKKV